MDYHYFVEKSEWRIRERSNTTGFVEENKVYLLEALVDDDLWETFGQIDMDVAGSGFGEDVAKMIVSDHNNKLKQVDDGEK